MAQCEESTWQCRSCRRWRFTPWAGMIPWWRKWQLTPILKIPWTEEPGRLQPMGSQRVRHDWATERAWIYITHTDTHTHAHTHTGHTTAVCGILVPQPGTELGPTSVIAPSPNYWTARELLRVYMTFIESSFRIKVKKTEQNNEKKVNYITINYMFLYYEKEMATHSSNLAWRIPGTEEPGRLQSMGLQRVRHDWATITHSCY